MIARRFLIQLAVILIATVLLANGLAQAQGTAELAILSGPVVNDDEIILQVAVKKADHLTASSLTAANFSVSEPSQDLAIQADPVLNVALAVIVDLSNTSNVDLIQGTLRSYFNNYYLTGDLVTFYILGTDPDTRKAQVIEAPTLDDINNIITSLVESSRAYSVADTLQASLQKVQALQDIRHPGHVMYVGSFLKNPGDAETSTIFGSAGIPFYVLQAHSRRSTVNLQKLAESAGGVYADNEDGSAIVDGKPVNLVKIAFDALQSSRTAYTVRYHTTNTSLEPDRTVTLTVSVPPDLPASASFQYQFNFQSPVVQILSPDVNRVRSPKYNGDGTVAFSDSASDLLVAVSFSDGVVRGLSVLSLQILDANTQSILKGGTDISNPQQDVPSGNYKIPWSLDSFTQPGTKPVLLKVTATDELGKSSTITINGSVTVRDFPPSPTPTLPTPTPTLTPTETPTPLPPTETPTPAPTVVPIVISLSTDTPNSDNAFPLLPTLTLGVAIMGVLLTISRFRLKRGYKDEQRRARQLKDSLERERQKVGEVEASKQELEQEKARVEENIKRQQEGDGKTYGRLVLVNAKGWDDAEIMQDVTDILINRSEFVIGRSEENTQYTIDQPYLSPQHCKISYRDGKIYVRDLNTKNGVFLDGERIPRDKDTMVPRGVAEIWITHNLKFELWDADTPLDQIKAAQKRAVAGQTRATAKESRVKSTQAGGLAFRPLPGIKYADDNDDIDPNYTPI